MPIVSARYEDHAGGVRFAFAHTTTLVQGELLENAPQVLATGGHLLEQRTVAHLLFEEVGREELAAHGVQNVLHFGVATVLVVLDPLQDGVVNLALLLNVELVLADELD